MGSKSELRHCPRLREVAVLRRAGATCGCGDGAKHNDTLARWTVGLSYGTNTVMCATTLSMFCSLRGQLAMHKSCSIVGRGNLSHSPSAYQRYKCSVRLQPASPRVGEGGPSVRFRTAHKSGWRHEWRQPDRLGFVTARTVAPWPTRDVGAELNTAYTPPGPHALPRLQVPHYITRTDYSTIEYGVCGWPTVTCMEWVVESTTVY